MKRYVLVIVFAVLAVSACGEKSNEVAESVKSSSPPVVEQSMAPPVEAMEKVVKAGAGSAGGLLSHDEGLALAGKSGCLVCHKIEGKLVGPPWAEVSKRYKGDAGAKARLAVKVKAGGGGNWTAMTGGIPMPPNSPKVSDEDIEKLVTFILSL